MHKPFRPIGLFVVLTLLLGLLPGELGTTTAQNYPAAVPVTPTNVQASDGSSTNWVEITWGSVPGATVYFVYRATSPDGDKTTITSTSSTSWQDRSADLGTIYYYWVRAWNVDGFSGYGGPDQGSRRLSPPTNLQASDGTYAGYVLVTWSPSEGASVYRVFRASSVNGPKTSLGSNSNTEWADTTATAGATYYYWVKACDVALNCSSLSDYDTGSRKELYTASGRVLDGEGNPVPGVTVSAGNGRSAGTDANGVYTIADLPAGRYTLAPSKEDWLFTPVSRMVVAPPDAVGQDFTGSRSMLAGCIKDLVADSREQMLAVSRSAGDVAVVGDYFIDKQEVDKVERVVNVGLNTISLLGVDWGKVGNGLEHIAEPGYKAALHASWRGWVKGPAAKHWFKPLYDALHNNRQLVFEEVTWRGLQYYAKEGGKEGTKYAAKKWLLENIVPGSGTPVQKLLGDPAVKLGNSYRDELLREQEELLADLPTLGLSSTEQEAYCEDMSARQEAHEQMVGQLLDHRDLLWDGYQDALADDAKWWKFWGPIVAKWVVIGAATLIWEGAGYYVASAGMSAVELIYDYTKDTRALEHDGKMLDQSLRYLEGRTTSVYSQVALNTVAAMNLVRADDVPEIAEGSLGAIEMKSFGHYRLWPDLWWAEKGSRLELPLTNSSALTTTYLTSASYEHKGFWTGAERLMHEGESVSLASGQQDSAWVTLKSEGYGISPDEGTQVDILVLGATATGIYPVTEAEVSWVPTRLEKETGQVAALPAGYTAIQSADAPARPYPLSSLVTTPPGTTDHNVVIFVMNPFSLTVSATVTQPVSTDFEVLDADGAELADNALVWTEILSPEVGLEFRTWLGWEGTPGESRTLASPVLALSDPDTGHGDTYTGKPNVVDAPWPLQVEVRMPTSWETDVATSVEVTLTNISQGILAQGQFTATIHTPDGTLLWQSTLPVNIAPQGTQSLTLPATIATSERYVAVSGKVALGLEERQVFLEVVPVKGWDFYLPLVFRNR